MIQLRNGSNPQHGQISSFGVMLDAKEIWESRESNGSSVTVAFIEPVRWNMWYFRTSTLSPDLDPVCFSLEEYDSDSAQWRTIGSSMHVLIMSTRTFFHGPFDTTLRRNSSEVFDYRSDSGQVSQLMNPVLVAVFVTLASLCGILRREELGRRMLCTAMLSCCVSSLISSAWYLTLGGRSGRVTVLYYAAAAVSHGLSFILLGCLEQERLKLFFGSHGAFFLGWACSMAGRPCDGPYPTVLWALALGAPTAALAAGIQASRWWMVRAALRLVRHDRRRYDAMWADLCARDLGGLAAIAAAEVEAQRSVRGDPRQRRPPPGRAESGGGGDGEGLGHGRPEARRPETSLVALRSAAARAGPLLRSKVAQWSGATGGLHRHRDSHADGSPRFVPLPPAGSLEQAPIRWAEPKGAERAAEKAVRAYGGDVSLLVDLARQSIVYETPAALAAGLRAMAGDREVAIARVKNRLRVGYDAGATAGYRDVLVNLRLVGAPALDAGVADHVCEVCANFFCADCVRVEG